MLDTSEKFKNSSLIPAQAINLNNDIFDFLKLSHLKLSLFIVCVGMRLSWMTFLLVCNQIGFSVMQTASMEAGSL